jgi:hypothetical protein
VEKETHVPRHVQLVELGMYNVVLLMGPIATAMIPVPERYVFLFYFLPAGEAGGMALTALRIS